MKRLLQILSIIILGSILISAQEGSTGGELNFDVINNNGSLVEINFELVRHGNWDAPVHNLTGLFHFGYLSTYTNTLLEFLACWETFPLEYYRTFGLGYYKFTVHVGFVLKDSLYIDYRTSTLPENYNLQGCGDIEIDFDVETGKLYYDDTQTEFPTYTSIWEEKTWVGYSTSELELYLTVSNQNNNPYLEWNAYHDPNIVGYNVYRKITTSSGTITEVESTTNTYYLDEEFYIDPPKTPGDDEVEYWIKAKISSTQESLEGNHVQVVGTSINQWKISGEESNNDLDYSLSQNYPNPFNPVTTIEFTLKESSIVSLRIFNILGREVKTIINERLESGSHQVEFDGGNLESGVYFYEIQANNFRDVKKLILLK
jgi:hypothetical protein